MGSEHRLNRRAFLGAAAGTAAAAALGPSARVARAGTPTGSGHVSGSCSELALINGRIHTFDDADTVVDSVRIRGNRFAGVGDGSGDVDPAHVIDLQGRTVIPGLIDNHVHFIRMGNLPPNDTRQLENAYTVEAALEVIAARTAEVPDGEFITAFGGIARRQFAEGRFPNLAELDEAAPLHPVWMSESTFGPGQTNTLGREGLRSRGVPVGDDGVVAATGPTVAAFAALTDVVTNSDRKRQLLAAARHALSVGLTTVQDQAGNVPVVGILDRYWGYDFFQELVRDDALEVRTRLFLPGLDEEGPGTVVDTPAREEVDRRQQQTVHIRPRNNQLQEILDNRWKTWGPDMAKFVGIGEWAVGLATNSNPRGLLYRQAVRLIAEHGWPYHQHVLGAPGIDGHLEVWEEMNREIPLAPLYWSLDHLSGLNAGHVARANELGIGLAMHTWEYLTGSSLPPFRMALDLAEVPVGGGGDGVNFMPLNPWPSIYAMVTGRNSGQQLVNDGQQITREEAIRMYASPVQGWFAAEEDELGGIGVGRYADLVVLSADFFDEAAVPDEAIRNMTSLLTIVDGEIVHDARV